MEMNLFGMPTNILALRAVRQVLWIRIYMI
jgi:hypothetical protein